MPLDVPPTNMDGTLRYYTDDEKEDIDLKLRGTGEEHDHLGEEMGPDGAGTNRRYSCAWAERFAAALMLVGYAQEYDDSGTTKISRLLPDSYDGLLSHNWVCTKVRLKPYAYTGAIDDVDFGQKIPQFTRCDIDATYEMVPYKLFDDDELPETGELGRYVVNPGFPGADITSSTNVIAMAGGMMNFASSDGTSRPAKIPIPYGIGFPETITNKKVIWRRVPLAIWGPDKPLTQMVKGDGTTKGYIGSLNLTEFLGHPPLTLKLEGVEEKLLPDATGLGYAWDIGYVMSEKNVPFGHTGLWFGETKTGGGSVASAYYQALNIKTSTNASAATLAADDTLALFQVREFHDLFVPGGV